MRSSSTKAVTGVWKDGNAQTLVYQDAPEVCLVRVEHTTCSGRLAFSCKSRENGVGDQGPPGLRSLVRGNKCPGVVGQDWQNDLTPERFFCLGSDSQRTETLKSSNHLEPALERPQRRGFRERRGGGQTVRGLHQRTAKEVWVLNHWNHAVPESRGEGDTAAKGSNAGFGRVDAHVHGGHVVGAALH
eukprot:5872552-Amphidinium_carterae.1